MSDSEKENNESKGDKKTSPMDSSEYVTVEPGTQIGSFRIEKELGRGGMGVVYLAHDTELDRLVAMKSLPTKLATDPQALSRLEHEARILASLNHPNIATIHEKTEQTEGGCYIVLEYVPGPTLAERIAGGTLDLEEALKIGLQIAEALSAAHDNGVVHRDLKPNNIKISPEDNVKILDFGVARVVGSQASKKDSSAGRVGRIAGTPYYMSPEQILDKATDHSTDIWSFGCVLYEMLSGMRAFPGDSTSDALASVLAAEPDLEMLPKEVPRVVRKIIGKCLTTNIDLRYESVAELRQDLQDCLTSLTALPVDVNALWRFLQRPRVAVSVGLVFLALCGTALWLFNRNAKIEWARAEALPQIVRLIEQDKYFAAFALAKRAETYISGDSVLIDLWPRMSRNCSIITKPAGTEVFFSEYSTVDTDWKYVGRSPLESIRVPFGTNRWKVTKEGFETVVAARVTPRPSVWRRQDSTEVREMKFTLPPEGSLPPDMVCMPSSTLELRYFFHRYERIPAAPAYLINKYEVTNKHFKEFMGAGGYRNPDFWKDLRFLKDGHELSWEQAIAKFRDSTGHTGPSTWEAGTYPNGQDDYPVSGVSWFEAAAYAKFKGKSLPTVYHWIKAALSSRDVGSIIRLSNFGAGPAPVGSHRGIGRFGLYDAAGNVREWCQNAADDQEEQRCILGGAWGEPEYMFVYGRVRSPWDRDSANGFRCVRYPGGKEMVPEAAFGSIKPQVRDFAGFGPVSDETFHSYIDNSYAYDHTPLRDVTEATDTTPGYYRREKITFDAAYPGERVIAYLYLPEGGVPPYQTVVWFPGGGARTSRSAKKLGRSRDISSIIKSGRALLTPVYKGTYERRWEDVTEDKLKKKDTIFYRDWVVQMSQDLRRSIDYLETRDDIDTGKLAYAGSSWGAILGPIMLATEERLKVGLFFRGGICACTWHPASDPANFAPRVKVPVLMINGEYDSILPPDTAQRPLLNLLGTPKEHKKHITYPSGHTIRWEYRKKFETALLDWLDRYLGPVKPKK